MSVQSLAVVFHYRGLNILNPPPRKNVYRLPSSWLVSLTGRALHRAVSQRSRVRVQYKPEFFSGFLSATAKVAYIIATIFLHIILNIALYNLMV